MKILEQLPDMDDQQLANLRSNAQRLSTDGNEKQKTAATTVLEAVTQEIGARSAAKRKAVAERKAAAAKTSRTTKTSGNTKTAGAKRTKTH